MEFVLSDEGQKLWDYLPGLPDGPEKVALRRMPVRRDFYTPEQRSKMADSTANPYEDAKSFTYEKDWTGPLFNVIRFLVQVTCVDIHDEQREAWKVLAVHDFPARAMNAFLDVKLIGYDTAREIADQLKKNDKETENRMARQRSAQFRDQYRRAKNMAVRGF